jgi:hypothetical protein
MKSYLLWLSAIALTFVLTIGCGGSGGGGGSSATLIGRVLSVTTGGPLNPAATVQQVGGSPSTSTDLADGSFSLANVPSGTTQAQVVSNQVGWPTFTFNFPAATGTTVIGDLWVGPEQVTLRGRVLNSTNANPVANADVTFGGQNGKSGSDGVFNLTGVGYSSATQTAFWGIVGSVRANGFFKSDFNAAPNVKDGANVVNVGDILITPANDTNPPGPPYNITGRVFPIGTSTGCIVTLKQGATELRIFNVGNDGKYYFWITPGSYEITYQKGAQSAPTQNVNLTQPNETITVPDVTLN